MSDRRVTAELIPTGKEHEFIKVQVYYDQGGICYATYKQKPRGFYLSVGPVKIERGDGYRTESFGMFSAQAYFLESAARFNAKRLKELVTGVQQTEEYRRGMELLAQKGVTPAVVNGC